MRRWGSRPEVAVVLWVLLVPAVVLLLLPLMAVLERFTDRVGPDMGPGTGDTSPSGDAGR
jgi:hypothetical protein